VRRKHVLVMCDQLLHNIDDDAHAKAVVFHPDFAYKLFKNKLATLRTRKLYVYAIVNQHSQVSFYIAEKVWLINPDIAYINVKVPEREYLLKVAEFMEARHLVDCPKITVSHDEHR